MSTHVAMEIQRRLLGRVCGAGWDSCRNLHAVGRYWFGSCILCMIVVYDWITIGFDHAPGVRQHSHNGVRSGRVAVHVEVVVRVGAGNGRLRALRRTKRTRHARMHTRHAHTQARMRKLTPFIDYRGKLKTRLAHGASSTCVDERISWHAQPPHHKSCCSHLHSRWRNHCILHRLDPQASKN